MFNDYYFALGKFTKSNMKSQEPLKKERELAVKGTGCRMFETFLYCPWPSFMRVIL